MIKTEQTKFSISEKFEYKDSIFEAGIVKNSPHKVDRIYLRIGEMFFHLRDDEAFAIVNALSKALWCEYILKKHHKKLNWYTLKELVKGTKSKKNPRVKKHR